MKLKLLLMAYFDPLGLLTIQESIRNIKWLSRHEVVILNVFPDVRHQHNIQLAAFDGVIIHNTLAYFPQTVHRVEAALQVKFSEYEGIKVLMKQDEHVRTLETATMIGEKQFDLVLTCLPEHEIPKVYPRDLVKDAQFMMHYTGYISDTMLDLVASNEYNRCIDISYRGSIQPLQCGRLGFEKWKIGHSVSEQLKSDSMVCDISSQWSDRIYGVDWIRFLQCSRATLGVESGSNLFDLSGQVESQCAAFEKTNQTLQNDPELYYRTAHEQFLYQFEGNVDYAQISPRHFEAAVTRTLQILYEGTYSDIFIPYEHYIPLKRDLSNLDEVLELLNNASERTRIIDTAYEEIALNEAYHIKSFIDAFDERLETLATMKSLKAKPTDIPERRANVFMLVPHKIHLDPRIRWMEEGFSEFADVFCIGVTVAESAAAYCSYPNRPNHIHANMAYMDLKPEPFSPHLMDEAVFAWREKLYHYAKEDPDLAYPEHSLFNEADLKRHQWYCTFLIKLDKAFQSVISTIIHEQGVLPDCLVCCDLASLLPGVFLSKRYHIPLVYDAHEFWPYADVYFKPWETDFWLNFESVLLKQVDVPVTVSRGLAEKMEEKYHQSFLYVPNTELKKDHLTLESTKPQKAEMLEYTQLPETLLERSIVFLYQGAFAKGRGLKKLIKAWKRVDKCCLLFMRGPDNEYAKVLKAQAQQAGLLDNTVFFPSAVPEHELVQAACIADVGLIPYDPNTSLLYRYCCPNKLSQYMAAGLPILSNQLEEISKWLEWSNGGFVIDFDHEDLLIDHIHQLAFDSELRTTLGRNNRQYFLKQYHWEQQASEFYETVRTLIRERQPYLAAVRPSFDSFLNESIELSYTEEVSNTIDIKSDTVSPPVYCPKCMMALYERYRWIQILYRGIIPYKIRQSFKQYLNLP